MSLLKNSLKITAVGLASLFVRGSVRAQDTIPFTLTDYNNVLLPVVFNGSDTLLMMFHSSFTGVSITREGSKRCRSLHIDGEGTSESWAGTANSDVSNTNALRIGNSSWDGVMIVIDEQSGQGSDGKFGYDLFRDRVLEINYDRRELVAHIAVPDALSSYSALALQEHDGSLFVNAAVTLADSAYSGRFMLHTGYGGTCILGTAFMEQVGSHLPLDTMGVKELSDSFGSILQNVTTRTPAIAFGGHQFRDVRIQVMDRRSRFEDSVLGNDLLRRFNMFMDLSRQRILLKPNRSMKEAFSERF